jgi:hypothetical protein
MKMKPRPDSLNRAGAAVWPLAALLVALLLAALPAADAAARQDDGATAQEGDAANDDAASDGEGEPGDDGELPDIDEILEGDEQVLGGGGFTYDPGDRRDPFKSLLAASETVELRGPRPEGIPGLLIDEIVITGTFRTDAGYVAQVQSAESQKSFLLKQGDQLYDGDVVRISGNEIVFKQIVQDPTALKPFREVVKTLNPEKG